MRKFLTLAIVAVMSAAMLTGCGSTKSSKENNTSAEATTQAKVDYSKGLNKDGTLADVDAESIVTLPDYKNITLKKSNVEVTDTEVQTQIAGILQNFQTTKKVKDRAIKSGDSVNIDYVGKVDGKKFDEGSAKGYDLTIGSHSFIDNFEDQLVGHKPGEQIAVNVTFPANYSVKKLQGKAAVFTVKINYIGETVTPELTDELVKKNSAYLDGAQTADELTKKVKTNLEDSKMSNALWSYLEKNSKFKEIPDEIIDTQLDVAIEGLQAQAKQSGYDIKDYLTTLGYKSLDELRKAYRSESEDTVKQYLIADAIAKKENIRVTKKDMQTFLGVKDISSFTKQYGEAYVKRAVLNGVVIKNLSKTVKTK